MRSVVACLVYMLAIAAGPGSAVALTVTMEARSQAATSAVPVVRLTGMFERGDANEVRRVLAQLKAAQTAKTGGFLAMAELSSQGGDVIEGVKIGYAFREFGVVTVVRKSDICLSACAFAFLGGSNIAPAGEAEPHRLIELGGQVGFHNVALNPNGLRNSLADDRSATAEVFNIALGGSSLIIRFAADMGIDPRFISRMLGRPPDQIQYVDTVKEFLTLQVCPSEPPASAATHEQKAVNICANAMQWSDAALSARGSMTAGEARLLLLRHVEQAMSASRSAQHMAAHLRTAMESRNDAMIYDAYAGLKAAGLPLPELFDSVYEVKGSGPQAATSCFASLPGGDASRFEVAVRGPKGMSTAARSAPPGCRWLFEHSAGEIINPRRSTF